MRQLDRVSRELLARAWDAGAGPEDSPLTIDIATVCETYGLAKEGARQHNYTGQRGYHPLLAVAAGTGDVLMARLRKGRANTARGAANFLRETVARVRHAGATGALTVRADSGFYAHTIVARKMDALLHHHPTAPPTGNLIAIPETDWTPIPYWMDGAADVAETIYTPFDSQPDAAPVRLIVRAHARLPTGALHQLQLSRFHHGPRGRHPPTGSRPPPTRRGGERHPRPEVRRRTEPAGRFAANAAWLAVQVMAHNLARGIGLEERASTTKTLRRRFFSLAGRLTRSARCLTLHLPQRWPWETQFGRALARLRTIPLPN